MYSSFCSLLGPIFYFYIYVSSSVLSYCSIKHDDDDDDRSSANGYINTDVAHIEYTQR